MDKLTPFLTYFRDNPDYNKSDEANEFALMVQRNKAVEDFLAGRVDASYLLDLLESHDIDPIAYVDTVEDAIAYCIAHPELNLEIYYEE